MKFYTISLLVGCLLTTISFLGLDITNNNSHFENFHQLFIKSSPSLSFIFDDPAMKPSGLMPFRYLSVNERHEMFQYCNLKYDTQNIADCYTLISMYH